MLESSSFALALAFDGIMEREKDVTVVPSIGEEGSFLLTFFVSGSNQPVEE